MKSVFVVLRIYMDCIEIDSIWDDEEKAKKRIQYKAKEIRKEVESYLQHLPEDYKKTKNYEKEVNVMVANRLDPYVIRECKMNFAVDEAKTL